MGPYLCPNKENEEEVGGGFHQNSFCCLSSISTGARTQDFPIELHSQPLKLKKEKKNCWYIPVISALWRPRQEDPCEIEASLGFSVKPYFKKKISEVSVRCCELFYFLVVELCRAMESGGLGSLCSKHRGDF